MPGRSRRQLRASPSAVLHELRDGRVAAWNRFCPLVVVLDPGMIEIVGAGASRRAAISVDSMSEQELEQMRQLGLVDEGADSAAERFWSTIESRLVALDARAGERRAQHEPYGNLYLTNTACNLSCPYCVARQAYDGRPGSITRLARRHRPSLAVEIVDAYMRQRHDAGEQLTPISFNGGEILLEWELIQAVVEHVQRSYPSMEMRYLLNTNMTLMDRDKAEFLVANDFEVHLSIDGYQEAHDHTRSYRGGRGSFDEIIEKVEMFNSLSPASPITGFQGTIDQAEGFDIEKVFEMSKHGFVQARLAPNLMGVSEAEGRRKANLEAELYEAGLERELEITEAYFLTVKRLMEDETYSFFFNCLGLSAYPSVGLHVNVETQELSLLCGFIAAATVPYSKLERDISSPLLWQAARRFIHERAAALRGPCHECDVIGVCRGSCILMGLDHENRLNPGACSYQRQLWRRSIEMAHRHR